jgi:hypothetical protein
VVAACGLALGVCGLAAAQIVGGLTIRVLDANGPLPGATVTLRSDTQQIRPTAEQTDGNGRVAFPVLRAVGGYIIEVSFPGYGTQRRDGIRVKPGENQILTVQLADEYSEKVTVVAQRDVVDLEKTRTSTRLTGEFISDLPVPGRFYQNVLTFAPGVNDPDGDGTPIVHGSRDRDFKAMIEGISSVDPLTGQIRGNINPNSIEEIEIITAGAGVEYGRAQGGFANIIQKQGGNEFEGVADLIHRSSEFDGDGAQTVPADRMPRFDWIQPGIQVSGPILKDKLWYRLSHEFIDRDDPVNTVGAVQVVTEKQEIFSDQITWQVSDRNKLSFHYDSSSDEVSNFGVSSLIPPESALLVTEDTETYRVQWGAPYSPQIYVESKVAWTDAGNGVHPTTRGIGNDCIISSLSVLQDSQCFNGETGEFSGSYWRDLSDHRQRFTVKSDATVFARRKYLGTNHEFKFGFSIENERYVRDLDERASLTFFIYRPLPEQGREQPIDPIGVVLAEFSIPPATRTTATGATWGVYLRDQMRPLQNLTVEAGVRVDREVINSEGVGPIDPQAEFDRYTELRAELEAQGLRPAAAARDARNASFSVFENIVAFQEQIARILDVPQARVASFFGPATVQAGFAEHRRSPLDINLRNTNLSPFLAMTWDPWSNNKTKFAFTAGRHYNNIPFAIPTFELRPARTSVGFTARRVAGRWVMDDVTQVRADINPAASLYIVDRDLRTPYQDELTLTFERELAAETSMQVLYVKRRYRDQLQDTDINHVPADFGTCILAHRPGGQTLDVSTRDGILDDCTGKFVVVGRRPGEDPDPFGREGRIERPDGVPDLYTLNPFWGPVYRISNTNASDYEGITLAFDRRQYRGWELHASYTWSISTGNGEDFDQFFGDDNSNLDDEAGFQSSDQRHVAKLQATTITPWGVRLGGTVTWQTGLPYSLLDAKISTDAIAPVLEDFGTNEPRVRLQYPTGVRNDQRNIPYWLFDVRAAKEFNLGRGMNLQLAAEIYNLLNEGTYIIYNPAFETGYQVNGQNNAYRLFGRQFQLAAKVSF